MEQVELVQPDNSGVEEVVADKGYHSDETLVALGAVGVRSQVSEPERGRRCWQDKKTALSAQMIGLRFTAAAQAAGVESRVTAHSGRVGLASELTSRGCVDHRRYARWKLEDQPHGGPLLRRSNC